MAARVNRSRRKAGFSLMELMVAGSVLLLMSLALLEGIVVAAKIARENSEHLAAEALAFDIAWTRFNEEYKGLAANPTTTYTFSTNDTPVLASWPRSQISSRVSTTNGIAGKFIVSRVAWGPNNERVVEHRVFRSELSRIVKRD